MTPPMNVADVTAAKAAVTYRETPFNPGGHADRGQYHGDMKAVSAVPAEAPADVS